MVDQFAFDPHCAVTRSPLKDRTPIEQRCFVRGWDKSEPDCWVTISRFERDAAEHPERSVALTRWDAMIKLDQHVGEELTVLGSVQETRFADTGPAVAKLARNRSTTFDVVFFDRDVFLASGLQFKKGEYVQVRGVVSKYRDPGGRAHLQMQVSSPGQVLAPSDQLRRLLTDQTKEPDTDSAEPSQDEGD